MAATQISAFSISYTLELTSIRRRRPRRLASPQRLCRMFTILSQRNKKCTNFSQGGRDFRRRAERGTRGQRMLYFAYQTQTDMMAPMRAWASVALAAGAQPLLGDDLHRNLSAVYELISRAALTHTRPPFGISHVTIGNREVEVREEPAARTPFGTLLHFKKDVSTVQPRVLVVAPLS